MGWRLKLLNAGLRWVEKPVLSRLTDPIKARRRFERQARRFRAPAFSLFLNDEIGRVPVTWASCQADRAQIILYFHGGGYFMGSPATHRAMLARLSEICGLAVCLPDYRKAPQAPFPAGLKDARAVWDGLLARGYPPQNIILGGDSAGGGLMLALLAKILSDGGKPAAAFAFSPWTDLTLSGASILENADSELLLPSHGIAEARDYYTAGADPENPGISPLFADFPNPPPVYLLCSSSEILRDDTVRMAEVLRRCNGEVTVDMGEHLPHVWPMFQGYVPEADAALDRVAGFIRQQVRFRKPDEN